MNGFKKTEGEWQKYVKKRAGREPAAHPQNSVGTGPRGFLVLGTARIALEADQQASGTGEKDTVEGLGGIQN